MLGQFPAPPQHAPVKMSMNLMTMRVNALAILGASVAMAVQLPPDIQADRYLVRAERQIEEQDFAAAKESMDQILEFQEQHGLEVPAEFSSAMPRSRCGSSSTTKRSSP